MKKGILFLVLCVFLSSCFATLKSEKIQYDTFQKDSSFFRLLDNENIYEVFTLSFPGVHMSEFHYVVFKNKTLIGLTRRDPTRDLLQTYSARYSNIKNEFSTPNIDYKGLVHNIKTAKMGDRIPVPMKKTRELFSTETKDAKHFNLFKGEQELVYRFKNNVKDISFDEKLESLLERFEDLDVYDIHYKTEKEANVLAGIAYAPMIALAVPAVVLLSPFIFLDEAWETDAEINAKIQEQKERREIKKRQKKFKKKRVVYLNNIRQKQSISLGETQKSILKKGHKPTLKLHLQNDNDIWAFYNCFIGFKNEKAVWASPPSACPF